jgi:hypothetical protein
VTTAVVVAISVDVSVAVAVAAPAGIVSVAAATSVGDGAMVTALTTEGAAVGGTTVGLGGTRVFVGTKVGVGTGGAAVWGTLDRGSVAVGGTTVVDAGADGAETTFVPEPPQAESNTNTATSASLRCLFMRNSASSLLLLLHAVLKQAQV